MTPDAEVAQVGTFIYGSCVSRDTFEYLPASFTLRKYVARQSLASAFTEAGHLKRELTPIASAFQRNMVHGDLEGSLARQLREISGDVDLLLVDLVDERGGVIDVGGAFVTKLNEFWQAGGREATAHRPHLAFGSEEHFILWSDGARQFLELLEDLGLARRTVVLRTPWASRYDDGEPLAVPTWMMSPAEADAKYARYFAVFESAGITCIDLPEDLARTPVDHQWGPSPFHYVADAYTVLAEHIVARVEELGCGDPRSELDRVNTRSFSVHGEPSPVMSRRDTDAWGVFVDVSGSQQVPTEGPVSRFLTVWEGGYPLDLMIEDNGAATTLISFHAALGGSGLRPPIFTGRSVSENAGVNRVFVSDPGLLASADLGLAWYLGTRSLPLTDVLVAVLTRVQRWIGAEHLVFFGMSGGGFASLNVAHEFPGSLAVPVNPQTRIVDYAEIHWAAFARAAFGVSSVEECRSALEEHPRADLQRVYAPGFDNFVIYLQNRTDGHVINQMVPWLDAVGWDDRARVMLGDWGRGHVPPPGPVLRSLLSDVAEVEGDWTALADRWGARVPSRDWVRQVSGR